MSVTAVPLRPVKKGAIATLWVGIAAVVVAAGGLAYAGTTGSVQGPSGFMAANAKKDGVVTLPSGLEYKVLKEGAGPKPTAEDVVLIKYVGKLTDGTVFDQNEQAPLPVDGVVPGFSEGLQQMQRGGSYRLWIPPELGYGPEAQGPIPANSVLVFDVDLKDFKSKAEIMQMQQQMQQMGLMPGAPGQMPPGQ